MSCESSIPPELAEYFQDERLDSQNQMEFRRIARKKILWRRLEFKKRRGGPTLDTVKEVEEEVGADIRALRNGWKEISGEFATPGGTSRGQIVETVKGIFFFIQTEEDGYISRFVRIL